MGEHEHVSALPNHNAACSGRCAVRRKTPRNPAVPETPIWDAFWGDCPVVFITWHWSRASVSRWWNAARPRAWRGAYLIDICNAYVDAFFAGELHADDVRKERFRSPIVVFDKVGERLILDGRNRLRACQMAGVEPMHTLWVGTDPIAYVTSANLHRRHQLAILAVEIEKLYAAEAKRGRPKKTPKENETNLSHFSRATISRKSGRSGWRLA